MAVPIVASSSSNNVGAATSLAIAKPAGLAVGDLMVACLVTNGAVSLTAPSGWTAIGSAVTDGFSACRQHAWRKVADSTDVAATDFTWTHATSGSISGGIARITGYDNVSASPINVSATGSATSGTSQTSPAVTTTVADCLILRNMASDSATTTITTSGVTNLWNTGITNAVHAAGYASQASAGSTGTATWTFGISNQMTAITIAIAPGSGGGTSAPIITSNGGGSTATVFVNEGNTAVTTVTASGIPTPTYSITGGANSASYSINSSSGALTRNSAIVYGAPEVVEVTATNSAGTDVQTITVVPNPMDTGATPSAPFNDAAYFYRPLANFNASNTQYPNLGTRDEPLVLGADYTADGRDAVWGSDGTGGYLTYTNAGDTACHADAPVAIVDCASFTAAVRITWNDSSTLATLFQVMKNVSLDEKNIFLHRQSDNTYEGRIWDGTTNSQVPVVGTSTHGSGTTDTVVLTYDSTTRVLTLYVNGTSEATNTSSNARRLRGSDYYLEWPASIGYDPTLCPNVKYRRMAFWTRALSGSEVTTLGSHTLWTTDNSEGVTATPTTATLSLASFAPSASVSGNTFATPDVVGLTLATFAPSAAVSDNIAVVPSTIALALTDFVPSVTASDTQVVTPGFQTLVIDSSFLPIVVVSSAVTITTGQLALALTTYEPTVATPCVSTPGVASLVTDIFEPEIQLPVTCTLSVATLALTTYAPDIGNPIELVPGFVSLSIATLAPVITTGTPGPSSPVPTNVANIFVGGYVGISYNVANIGEPTLARMEGVTNCDTDAAITDLELTAHVTHFFDDEDVVGDSFDVSVVNDDEDNPTNDYETTIPSEVTTELNEGGWYTLWWVGDGFLKQVSFVAKYGG